jgi:F-type H+-transporting ATPase subunit delta
MRLTSLARRYAAALFDAAKDADIIDKVESDLGLLTYSLQTMPRLKEMMMHPLIPAARKKHLAAEIFAAEIDTLTLNFLGLLIDKRREAVIEDIESEYVQLADLFRGIIAVTVTSAVTLTHDEQSRLKTKLEGLTGKKVELDLAEDPSIMGGLIVRIGDTVIDGSVTGYLAALKDQLLGRK